MSPGGDDNDASPSPDSCEHDQDGIEMTEQKHGRSSADPSHAHAHAKGGDKKITDPKDPLRPRRKKARRACFACQRAHLTCGMFFSVLLLSSVLLPFAHPFPFFSLLRLSISQSPTFSPFFLGTWPRAVLVAEPGWA